MDTATLTLGRRATDNWLASVIQEGVKRGFYGPIITHVPELVGRRPRRTKKQLAEAFNKALEAVRVDHPTWKNRRLKVRARNLVKLYKY